MTYSLAAAATATGTDESTILKSIEGGKIVATKDELGEWHIEPAELHAGRQHGPMAMARAPRRQQMLDPKHDRALIRQAGNVSGSNGVCSASGTKRRKDHIRQNPSAIRGGADRAGPPSPLRKSATPAALELPPTRTRSAPLIEPPHRLEQHPGRDPSARPGCLFHDAGSCRPRSRPFSRLLRVIPCMCGR